MLADMDTVREYNNISGAIAVYGKDDWGYLIFSNKVYRDKSELFFDANALLPQGEERRIYA